MAAPIFLHYDREALDREYDNRRKVAESAEHLASYAAQSARVRRILAWRFDLRYGATPAGTLDVVPATVPGAPVQVFIHGGYWHRMDKADYSYVAGGFAPAGAAVVVVNYALMPAVTMDELVRQCRAAVAWVHANAVTFGGDPGRIFISGHSAGGHLVAMLRVTNWPAFGAPPDVVKGGCGISGLYDLEPIRLCFLNDVLKLTPEDAQRNSPVLLAPLRNGRLIVAVGGLEGPEYHRQADNLAAAWRANGLAADIMDLAGEDHFTIAAQLADPRSSLTSAILRQMALHGSPSS